MNESRVVALARCTMSKEQYFDVLRQDGLLPARKEDTPKAKKK
jgi:hypothetical protein